MAAVRLAGVTKRFGSVVAVDAVDLEIGDGEFFALLGPSGCGKTTLLRLIGGFEAPDAGVIEIDGAAMTGQPPYARPVNTVFQSYALFPHMRVRDNIAFGLRQEGRPAPEIAARVAEIAALLRIEELMARRPDQISGGQRQRVALARALIKRPRVLLLDEPMAPLDRALREHTRGEIKRLQEQLGTAFVLVTHDQEEAMALATRMAVMRAGRIEQIGAPVEIYERPASRAVAAFIGRVNLFEGVVADGAVVTAIGRFKVANAAAAAGEKVTLALRPEKLVLGGAGENRLRGVVGTVVYRGEDALAEVTAEHATLTVRLLSRPYPRPGSAIDLSFTAADAVVLTR